MGQPARLQPAQLRDRRCNRERDRKRDRKREPEREASCDILPSEAPWPIAEKHVSEEILVAMLQQEVAVANFGPRETAKGLPLRSTTLTHLSKS